MLYRLSYNGVHYRFVYGVQRYGFIWNYQTKTILFFENSELSFLDPVFSLPEALPWLFRRLEVSGRFRPVYLRFRLFLAAVTSGCAGSVELRVQ